MDGKKERKKERRRSKVSPRGSNCEKVGGGYKGIPNPSYEFITSNGFSKAQETTDT
jgi:hypothetical protein